MAIRVLAQGLRVRGAGAVVVLAARPVRLPVLGERARTVAREIGQLAQPGVRAAAEP